MPEEYILEKWVWTEEDFERMGWHDCHIHAVAFSPEEYKLLIDIDYIFKWALPKFGQVIFKPEQSHFGFWVAPATLVFENIYEVEADIFSYSGGLEIDRIKREEAKSPRNAEYIQHDTEWLWTVECQEGDIRLRSAGYKQHVRVAPRLIRQQKIALSDRGGYSFAEER